FFFNATATTEIYTLSLHDALPIYIDAATASSPRRRASPEGSKTSPSSSGSGSAPDGPTVFYGHRQDQHADARSRRGGDLRRQPRDRKSTRLNSSHVAISYAVFCLK